MRRSTDQETKQHYRVSPWAHPPQAYRFLRPSHSHQMPPMAILQHPPRLARLSASTPTSKPTCVFAPWISVPRPQYLFRPTFDRNPCPLSSSRYQKNRCPKGPTSTFGRIYHTRSESRYWLICPQKKSSDYRLCPRRGTICVLTGSYGQIWIVRPTTDKSHLRHSSRLCSEQEHS